MRRLALAPTLVCAFLSPPAAFALGVGDIELQSALNQPLDAEIPLRGVPPEQGDDVIVTLASEEAFRQVGLERAHSLTRLQFAVVSRDGSPYIQVSSREPISEPFLNFLIEVDAPDGNLLREYTVLLDPPVFASQDDREPAQPSSGVATDPDMAPDSPEPDGDSLMNGEIASGPAEVAEESSADRGGDAVGATGPADGEESVVPDAGPVEPEEPERPAEPEGAEREGEFGDTPVFLQVAQEEEEAERQQREQRQAAREAAAADAGPAETAAAETADPAPASTAEAPSGSEEYGEVAEGETLWDIAEQLRRGDTSTQQMMLALLRYNPEAFEDGNINRLKEGYVLRVPREHEVRSVSAQQAIARVREQNGLWREWRDSIRQEQATQVASAQEEQPTGDRTPAEASDRPADEETPVAAREDGDGRLDIVGAEEGGATSDESASATASEAAVSEELKLAREELASVEAEKEELADRVAQLEDTVEKMEQLVTVRENQLAQLQEQLRELEEEAGAAEGGSVPAVDDEDDAAAAPGAGPAAEPGSGEPGSPDGGGDESAVADAGGAESVDNARGSGAAEDASGAQTSASDEQQEIVSTETEPPQRGWLDTILGTLAGIGAAISGALAAVTGGGMLSPVLLGAAVLLVLALGLVAVQRRRAARVAAEEEELAAGVAAAQAAESDSALPKDGAPASSDASLAQDTADEPPEGLLEDDLDLSDLDDDPGAAAAGGGDGEKDDTVAEADVYLAYGLHQQAEDLLRLALQETPNRQDYHEKLLETLFAAGKSDEFATAASDFRQQFGGGQAWQRVAAMGQKIAPQHALFAAGAAGDGDAASGAATAASASDEDLAIDLDLGATEEGPGAGNFTETLLAEGESATAPASGGGEDDDDLAFDLSDLDEGAPSEAPSAASTATVAGPAEGPGEDADAGLEFDLSSLDLDSGETPEPESASETSQASGAGDAGGLDFDIGDLGELGGDAASAGGSADAPATAQTTPAASEGGDDLGLDLDDALGLGEKGGESGASENGFDFSEFEQTDLGGGEAGQEGDTAAELEAPELDTGLDLGDSLEGQDGDDTPVMDFDLSGLEGDSASSRATGEDSGPAENAAGGAMSDEGEDLATMLDLAKAYIDMGDAESASNALEEVIAGGNEEQRAEARNLLETVQ